MSRVANKPIQIPKGVEVSLAGQVLKCKGPKGEMTHTLHENVKVEHSENVIKILFSPEHRAIAGTSRALINNVVMGVSQGFQRTLLLQGVGYRAQVQGKTLNLTLGLSHPVNYLPPAGITIETPSQTEIVVKGTDKQLVGQVSADIRSFRPPEPYKGKGIRYKDEHIIRKETKKK